MNKKLAVTKETIVLLPDAHMPYVDEKAFNTAIRITGDLNPEKIIILGDWIDMYQFSKFFKDPSRMLQLQSDLDCLAMHLKKVRTAAPSAEIQYLQGNHEERIIKWLSIHPEISQLRDLQPENLLGLKALDINYITDYIELYGYVITHGSFVRKDASASAKAQMDRYMTNGISGHTHRLAKFTRKNFNTQLEWIEAGCLCDLKPSYMPVADWVHGFVVATAVNGKLFTEVVEISEGKALFRGELYK
jgi:predicted phosphodiesterase